MYVARLVLKKDTNFFIVPLHANGQHLCNTSPTKIVFLIEWKGLSVDKKSMCASRDLLCVSNIVEISMLLTF